jgi:hypothetical protein
MQVGILNGIGQNPVSLQNTQKVNIMIGTVIVGINLMIEEGPTKGKIRKLSVMLLCLIKGLHEGGELEFDFRNEDPDMKKPNMRSSKRNIT